MATPQSLRLLLEQRRPQAQQRHPELRLLPAGLLLLRGEAPMEGLLGEAERVCEGFSLSFNRRPVQVVLDLWEHLEICREGQMSWLSRQLDEADFIITVCSRGLR